MFNLAWDGKGSTIDLLAIPPDIFPMWVSWRDERVEEENDVVAGARV